MATLTINHSIELVNNFIDDVTGGNNSYYCFVSQNTPWLNANGIPDDTLVPSDSTSVQDVEQIVYENLAYGKLLTNTDIIAMAPRYTWANGTVFACYNNADPNLYEKNFFVITDTNSVYKCIYNGFSQQNADGVPSTVKPTVTQTSGSFATPDGYIWKYMYTCDPNVYSKFQTSNFIPVTPNSAVTGNAIPGTIDNIIIANSGINYQIFEEGFLLNYVNNYVVQLPTTSAPFDNYYTDSAIYLKAGFGAGQLRQITSYSGLSKLLSVAPPFNLYENLKLSNINGQFNLGDLVTQSIASVYYFYGTGYFNPGDVFIQTETGAQGLLRHSNTTTLVFELQTANNNFVLNYPIYNSGYSPTKKNGLVSIANNSLYVNSVSGTYFANDYAVGSFIRVGESSNTNIRRVTAVNSSVITVDTFFNNTIAVANNYLLTAAASVDSVTSHSALGSIVYTNLNSAEITYSNTQPPSESLILGETVVLVDGSNTSQGANGTISYIDDSTIILSDVQGPVTANLFLYGLSSQVVTHIDTNISYPNITVDTQLGGFQAGMGMFVTTANGIAQGNGFVVSLYSSPDELTEYIISPNVVIEGDGNGAFAYCTVDLSGNNSARALSSVVLVNNGEGYTNATIKVYANTLYGNGAVLTPLISPVSGHGSDAYTELGATYAGISKLFDTGVNESYKFPLYGSYRTVGILKNPFIFDTVLTVNNFTNMTMTIGNTAGSFSADEIILQPYTNAAAVVISSNSTHLTLTNFVGNFVANTSNDSIYGLVSGATANCKGANTQYFTLVSNSETLIDSTSGGTSQITQIISNNQIRISNTYGTFHINDSIIESYSNTSATITGILISNGTVDVSTTFGQKFNQHARITLSSNTADYQLYEYVVQDVTFATGRVISTKDEMDLSYTTSTPFALGETIINANTGANAVITFANNTLNYLQISAISSNTLPFNVGDTIRNASNTKSSVINNIYSVLVLDDVNQMSSTNTTPFIGHFQTGGYNITGQNSGAVGISSIAGGIKLPDFVRETGKVIYLENMTPFVKSPTSTEQVKLIVKL